MLSRGLEFPETQKIAGMGVRAGPVNRKRKFVDREMGELSSAHMPIQPLLCVEKAC